jgi:CxxC motif-containing protein (DUF1111 family)
MKRSRALLLTVIALAGAGLATCGPRRPPGPPNGAEVFSREFSLKAGLGPRWNATSCVECHDQGGAGGPGEEVERHEELPGCAGIRSFKVFAAPGLQPEVPPDSAAFRRSNDLFASGMIAALTDEQIRARAGDPDGNGVGGIVNLLPDNRIGRFGRKAQVPTLEEFVRLAFLEEQGLEVPRELSEAELEAAVAFVRGLRLPPVEGHEEARALFESVGCAECHPPPIYTDVLLYELEPDEDMCFGSAQEAHFRSEPLIGLRLQKEFMHDGQSLTIEDAIRRHGGAARSSRAKFLQLDSKEKQRLLEFLGKL